MLSYIEVRNSQGATLVLPLEDPEQGFYVDEIEGLDPVRATLVSSSFANKDGAMYQSSRREPRNIVLKLGLEPDSEIGTVRELRKALYAFFMPKSSVTLRFHMIEGDGVLDFLDLDIEGRVETFESPLFAQEPQVNISLMCFDPDFRDNLPMYNSFVTAANTGDGEHTINYPGTVDTGIEIVLRVNRNVGVINIAHRPPDNVTRKMQIITPLAAGDLLLIETTRGDKGVYRIRDGEATSVLYGLSPDSAWFEFQPGANVISVVTEGAPVPYDVNNLVRHGGL